MENVTPPFSPEWDDTSRAKRIVFHRQYIAPVPDGEDMSRLKEMWHAVIPATAEGASTVILIGNGPDNPEWGEPVESPVSVHAGDVLTVVLKPDPPPRYFLKRAS